MLEDGDISSEDRPEFLNILGKMCRRLKTIPASMHIENCPNEPMDEEYGGGCGAVSRGEYRGRPVAIKTLHMYITSDFEERFGVSVKLSPMQRGIHSHFKAFRNFAGKL